MPFHILKQVIKQKLFWVMITQFYQVGAAAVPPNTRHQEISAELPGKERQGKKRKRRRNGLEKKRKEN